MNQKTIPIYEFNCEGSFAPAYTCSVSGNNSGVFVQKEHYDEANSEFVSMRDAYHFENRRAIKADTAATMFSERLVSVMKKLTVINSEDITSDDQFLCAVDGWLDAPSQNQSALELLKEAECPKKEDLLTPCENGLLRTSVMNSECLRCPWCAKREELING